MYTAICVRCGRERTLKVPPTSAICVGCSLRDRHLTNRLDRTWPLLKALESTVQRVRVYIAGQHPAPGEIYDSPASIEAYLQTIDGELQRLLAMALAARTTLTRGPN